MFEQVLATSATTKPHRKQRQSIRSYQSLIAGGVAGGVAKTAIAPFDRAKIMFQVCILALYCLCVCVCERVHICVKVSVTENCRVSLYAVYVVYWIARCAI